MNDTRPDRNLAMELARVTEAAALAAGRWIGHGDKNAADGAAVDAMRLMIDTVSMHGTVVIGEGEKDEAPMLFNGEDVGNGDGPGVDVAVDPIDGTRLTAVGQPNALSVIALAERGSMFFPGAAVYMEKVATGPEAADAIDITAPPEENVRLVAKAKGVRPEEISVTILDRPRHAEMIEAVRSVGARVYLITRRRRRRRDRRRGPAHRHRPADRHRRHARRRDRRRSAEVPRRRDPGSALPARRRRAAAVGRRRIRPRRGAHARRPRERQRRVLRGHRHHRWFSAAGRALLARRRHHALDGDAVAFGHGALGRSRASLRETRTVLSASPTAADTCRPHSMVAEPVGFRLSVSRTRVGGEHHDMAEKTILVCDPCGKPAAETVTIKVSRGNFVKDLCNDHVSELVAKARRPRPGRRKGVVAGAPATDATARSGGAARRRTANGLSAQRVRTRPVPALRSTPSRTPLASAR